MEWCERQQPVETPRFGLDSPVIHRSSGVGGVSG